MTINNKKSESGQIKTKFKVRRLIRNLSAVLGLSSLTIGAAYAADVNCAQTLYYCGAPAGSDVTVTTSVAGQPTGPLQGYGVYLNNSKYNVNNLTITTSGSKADGIMSNGNNGSFFVGKGLVNISNTGSGADGINLGVRGGPDTNFKNHVSHNTVILSGERGSISANGTAVRANNNLNANSVSSIVIGNNFTITQTGTSTTNGNETTGYAVYAGNRTDDISGFGTADWLLNGLRNNNKGQSFVFIGDNAKITSAGTSTNSYKGAAVYANKGGVIQLGDGADIKSPTGTYNLYASTEKQNIGRGTNNAGEVAEERGGNILLQGGVTLNKNGAATETAIYSTGADSIIQSGYLDLSYTDTTISIGDTVHASSGVFDVTGKIVADKQAIISLNSEVGSQYTGNIEAKTGGQIALNGTASYTGNLIANTAGVINLTGSNGSFFEGLTDNSAGAGTINLAMSGAASTWNVTGVSTLTDLELNAGAQVVFGDWTAAPENENRIILTMDTLSGNGGQFYIGTNLMRDSTAATIDVNDADMIRITGASSGTHTIFVYDDQTGASVPGDMGVRVVEADQRGANFVLGGSGHVDVGHLQFDLFSEDVLPTGASGTGNWALSPTPRLTNFAQNSVGLLSTNYLLSYTETQTLLQRMGELRSPGNEGDVWGRLYAGKLSSFDDGRIAGHNFKYNGMQFGVDRQLDIPAAEGQVYVGGVVGYTKGDTSYDVGSGKTEGYHVGVYGTYMMDNGVYVDGLLKYQHLKNSINSFTGGGFEVNGSDSSGGVSLGVEAGRRFYLQTPEQGWYLEPQGQLTYTNQGSSTIKGSNGLKTDLSSYNSVIGRLSLVAGYEIVEGANPVNVYFKTGYVREFDGKTSYTFNDSVRENYDFGGGWWDNGIGVNMRIDNRHNIFAEASYAKGGSFDKQQINLGYRFEF